MNVHAPRGGIHLPATVPLTFQMTGIDLNEYSHKAAFRFTDVCKPVV